MTPSEKAALLSQKISQEVAAAAGLGLNAARMFLVARIKEAIGVPAPRVPIRSGGAIVGYRATTPATPGAPIRKLSGRARNSVSSYMKTPYTAVVGLNAKSPKGFNYPKFHEFKTSTKSGLHPFMVPTIQKYMKELTSIIGQSVTTKAGI